MGPRPQRTGAVQRRSRKTVYGVLLANIAIAATKFAVALITGSSAMWAEGVHSSVDTGNQLLMLIGLRRSHRPADPHHPFGHGKELYFWNLLVAVLIFGAGGGISVYQGVLHILHPVQIENAGWNYIVLGFAFLFEGISLYISLRVFTGKHCQGNLPTNIAASKDPTTYTVIAEDTAALAGITIAAAGIFLSVGLHMPILDGVASVLIGLLLAIVATLLIRECRGLLTGEGVDRPTAEGIRALAGQEALVEFGSASL